MRSTYRASQLSLAIASDLIVVPGLLDTALVPVLYQLKANFERFPGIIGQILDAKIVEHDTNGEGVNEVNLPL